MARRFLRRLVAAAVASILCLPALVALTTTARADTTETPDFKALVFSKTSGYRHASIPAGIQAIKELGQDNDFAVDTTEDASTFTYDNLKQYAVVIFVSTTGDPLATNAQKAALKRYIESGGGYVGIHAAADSGYEWQWYGDLVGAYFKEHPSVQQATVTVEDSTHPSTEQLPTQWTRTDEWYDYRSNPRGDVHVLASLQQDSYNGSSMGADHPIMWCQAFDGGRSWYTGMGHTKASYSDPKFRQMLLGGIKSAAGVVDADCASTNWSNFDQVTLAKGADEVGEPEGLAVLPNGDVIHTARKGHVYYSTADGETNVAADIPVYTHDEEGLQGIAVDPNFSQNHWVYLYYGPPLDTPSGNAPETADDPSVFDKWKGHNQLSRFKLDGKKLDMSTEQKILQVGVDRGICCHVGGDITFGPKGNLYLSTGDDTNPFQSSGYAPLDKRKNRNPAFDDGRSAGNTNDLRGSILRIDVQPDGSYTIPDGNLFAGDDNDKTRGEIYAMGMRNPYRISVTDDGVLYVGNYGPDAGAADPDRGPAGTVEFERITEPGFYGWPYCIGKNKAYNHYNWATEESGPKYDCEGGPVNDSPRNDGLSQLPPAIPAWLPYNGGSVPQFGNGSESPMAGPVYSYDPDNDSKTKFPAYYDGKFFAYEFGRGWIKTITVGDNGDHTAITPFFPGMKLKNPFDLEFGPDGSLYVLDYGPTWYAGDPSSAVYRIDYVRGNRSPQVSVSADPAGGTVPLTVDFSTSATDPEGDTPLTYEWAFGDGGTSSKRNPSHTYIAPGDYTAEVTVTDATGAATTASVSVSVETPPVLCLGDHSDEFDGTSLDTDRWTVIRPDGDLEVADGHLAIPTSPTDIYGTDSEGTPNIVVQKLPSGSWQATTKLTLDADEAYQQAGLVLYGDDDNYAKMVYQGRDTTGNDDSQNIFQFIREENGDPHEVDGSNTDDLGSDYPDTVYVRMTSDGSDLTAAYSADGAHFTRMPQTKSLESIDNPRIGVIALAGADVDAPVIDAQFDWFHISPDPTAEEAGPDDEFDGDELNGCRWDTIVRPDPSMFGLSDGQLEIDTSPGDIYGDDNTDPKNFILQSAPDDDWTIETKIDGSAFNQQYHQGGLMVYGGDDNYIKFDYITDNQEGQPLVRRIELRSEVDGTVQEAQPQVDELDQGVWYLRLTKEGDTFHGYYSADGDNWTEIGVDGTPTPVKNSAVAKNADAGVFAYGQDQAESVTAKFDYFHASWGDGGGTGDTTAPTTKAATDPAEPDGDHDWFTEPVRVTVTAEGENGGSGVATIETKVDGGDWAAYDGPVTVEGDGEHTVAYRATDKAGNTAETQEITFKIDATAPTVSVSGVEDDGSYGDSDTLSADWSAEDATSGLASVTATLDGKEIDSLDDLPAYKLALGDHTLVVTATDKASNTGKQERHFEVVTSLEDMGTLVDRFHADGRLTASAANALQVQLKMTARHMDRGIDDRAVQSLRAFVEQIDRHVSDQEVADVLKRDAEAMITRLGGSEK